MGALFECKSAIANIDVLCSSGKGARNSITLQSTFWELPMKGQVCTRYAWPSTKEKRLSMLQASRLGMLHYSGQNHGRLSEGRAPYLQNLIEDNWFTLGLIELCSGYQRSWWSHTVAKTQLSKGEIGIGLNIYIPLSSWAQIYWPNVRFSAVNLLCGVREARTSNPFWSCNCTMDNAWSCTCQAFCGHNAGMQKDVW